MADPKRCPCVQELNEQSMKTIWGGGVIIDYFNPQPEPPGFNPQPEPPGVRKAGDRTIEG